MKVLVMGGSRFVGLHSVLELEKHGHQVTVFNRGQTPLPLEFPASVKRLYGDRHDLEGMMELFRNEDFDAVVDVSAYFLADVESMVKIFKGRIGHYVFMCTPAIYDLPQRLPLREDNKLKGPEWPDDDYGRNKAICEAYLTQQYRENGFPWSSIRLPIIMGPYNTAKQREQLMFHRLLQGRPILIPGDGSTVLHSNYIPDMAIGMRKMLLNPRTFGEPYNAAMQEYWSDESWVDAVAEVVGVTPNKVFMPHDVTTAAYQGGWGYQPIQRTQAGRIPWYRSCVFDTRKYIDHVGHAQEHTLKGALAETYEWFRRDGLDKSFEWDFSKEDATLAKIGGK